MSKHCGFVAIVGRPNVGKSTLLNHIIGEKLAGVSPKPQTTRGVIRGIHTQADGQIIFVDTPGHHDPHDGLGRWMLGQIEKTLESIDLVYWMVVPKLPGAPDEKILGLLSKRKIPKILLINQVDRYPKPEVLPVIEAYHKLMDFEEIIPISAKLGTQVPLLLEKTVALLPEGEFIYPEDQISDQQERLFIQEIIREKIFRLTSQEVPYSSSVAIEKFSERSQNLIDIKAVVMVEKESQKGIMIGKKGAMLKQIGQDARREIEPFLGKKVFLELWVKVAPGWKSSEDELRHLGFPPS